MIADQDANAAKTIAKRIGAQAVALSADVRKSADAKAMVDGAVQAFGRLDILVNNAGRGILGTVVTTAEDDWDDIVAVNLKSVFLCSKHAIPVMKSEWRRRDRECRLDRRCRRHSGPRGLCGLEGRRRRADPRHGARSRRRQYPRQCGRARRDLVELLRPHDAAGAGPGSLQEGLQDRAPMGRIGEPKDIANAILFLASDKSSFATGSVMLIDGGYTAR